MDKIIIKGLKLFAYHGVNDDEKEIGQNFILDIAAYVDRVNFKFNDALDTTVSYAKMIKLIRSIVTENRFNLIETLSEVVARELINNFMSICRVDVEVKKPEAPMRADFKYVAISITRTRGDYLV